MPPGGPTPTTSTGPTPLGWRPGAREQLGLYVYRLIDPRSDRIFYVGKGAGERCFAPIVKARRRLAATRSGDYVKLDAITDIESESLPVGIEILRHCLDEDAAFMLESATIDFPGIDDLADRVVGLHAVILGQPEVTEINTRLGAPPVTFFPQDKAVLIRVAREFHQGMDEPAIDEATRRWWRVDVCQRQLHGPRAPEFALSVLWGVVAHRGFWGTPDDDVLERYGFREVTAFLPQAAQKPLRYVYCGI